MSTKEPATSNQPKTFDSAYGFLFANRHRLFLFIAGLVVSLTGAGAEFGTNLRYPFAGGRLAVPLIMMRDQLSKMTLPNPALIVGLRLKPRMHD